MQQYIKVYMVAPDVDPRELIEAPFAYEDYVYSFSDITAEENSVREQKVHAETVTVETKKKDLTAVLAALEPTMDYDDGVYSGVLSLDHTTIHTEAAGYTSGSYTVSAVREIGNLDSNDVSYVPATTVKDGRTLALANVEWQVQGTALVGDTLVPSLYKVIATYTVSAPYSAATGYVTTADYVGKVARDRLQDVTYTVTYVGSETVQTVAEEPEQDGEARSGLLASLTETAAENRVSFIIGLISLLALAAALLLFISARRQAADAEHDQAYEKIETISEMEETEHEIGT